MRGQNVDRRYSAALRKVGTPIPRKDEKAILIKAQAGDKAARDKLVLGNIGMAMRLANAYSVTGAPVEDLFHVALEGAIEAIGKFDVRRNLRFYTYATHWMRAAITRYIQTSEATVRGRSKAQTRTLKLLCEATGAIRSIEEKVPKRGTDAQPFTLAHTLTAPERDLASDLDSLQVQSDVRRALLFVRRTLKPIELDILDKRLLPDEKLTLEQIATPYGCSREWVRLLEKGLKRRLQVVLAPIQARRAA